MGTSLQKLAQGSSQAAPSGKMRDLSRSVGQGHRDIVLVSTELNDLDPAIEALGLGLRLCLQAAKVKA